MWYIWTMLDNLGSYFDMLTSYTLYMYTFTLQQSANTDSLRINDEVLPHWHLIHKYIHCYQDVSDFTYSGYIPKQTPELLFYFNRDLFLKCNIYFSIQPTNSHSIHNEIPRPQNQRFRTQICCDAEFGKAMWVSCVSVFTYTRRERLLLCRRQCNICQCKQTWNRFAIFSIQE